MHRSGPAYLRRRSSIRSGAYPRRKAGDRFDDILTQPPVSRFVMKGRPVSSTYDRMIKTFPFARTVPLWVSPKGDRVVTSMSWYPARWKMSWCKSTPAGEERSP